MLNLFQLCLSLVEGLQMCFGWFPLWVHRPDNQSKEVFRVNGFVKLCTDALKMCISAWLLASNCKQFSCEIIMSIMRDYLQNLTLVMTVFPFSDKCLSTYPEDSRSLGTERKEKRESRLENLWFSFKCHSVMQACLYFIGGLYSVLAAQSFRASALLIMTSEQGRGYFQHTNSHKHNYTNPAF